MDKTRTNPILAALSAVRWNAYSVGVGIGLLSCVSFLTMDKAIGTSTSFVHVAGFIEGIFAPGHVIGEGANAYYAKEISAKTPMFDWQMMLVIGVFLGALLSNRLSRGAAPEMVPGLWAWRFGPSVRNRYVAAFGFGVVMLFGARMAGGCTSGHGISGGLQLAVSSWTFFLAMFVSGVATAFALYGKRGRDHVLD